MKYVMFACAVLFALEANAGDCQNGRCGLRSAPSRVVQATGEVVHTTVQTTKNVAVGTVRAVTPPYNCRRCRGGRCHVR